MQVVLEAVADAVSQLILFSVEADENKSVLQNISKGASGVSKAVQILVNIGEGTLRSPADRGISWLTS